MTYTFRTNIAISKELQQFTQTVFLVTDKGEHS